MACKILMFVCQDDLLALSVCTPVGREKMVISLTLHIKQFLFLLFLKTSMMPLESVEGKSMSMAGLCLWLSYCVFQLTLLQKHLLGWVGGDMRL